MRHLRGGDAPLPGRLRGRARQRRPRDQARALLSDADAALPPGLFDGLLAARGLLLAVSGGPDSTALLHLVAAWRPPHLPVHVATVDHGLRPEAHREAEDVAGAATALGLSVSVLQWRGEKPRARLQERARAARYALLFEAARSCGASHLVTAHTLDDQAETLLMRMADGSGPRGLVGMRPFVETGDLVLARPLLQIPKATLVALCRDRGWAFATDPSNTDSRYARARWRALAPALAAEGLSADRLGRLAARLDRADRALEAIAHATATACTLEAAAPWRAFAPSVFDAPDEIVLRVIDAALCATAPDASPRLGKLEVLFAALRSARASGAPLRRTLQGCLVTLDSRGNLTIAPEPPRRPLRER